MLNKYRVVDVKVGSYIMTVEVINLEEKTTSSVDIKNDIFFKDEVEEIKEGLEENVPDYLIFECASNEIVDLRHGICDLLRDYLYC